jgi:hypothetical protein
MFVILGKIFLYAVAGAIVTTVIVEGVAGGDILIKGTKKHDKFNRNTDDKIKNLFKNGTNSSKDELQTWWDTYHPPK